MDGIPDEEKESNEQCKMTLLDILANMMNMSGICQLCTVTKNANRPRIVIFKLQWFGDREEIWARRTALETKPYWLKQDIPAAIAQKRCILGPIVKAAKDQGKSAYLSVDCLVIDDVTYTVNTVWKLPKDLQPSTLAMKISDDKKFTAFFSASSQLSNFHPSDFVDKKGVPFHCSEEKLHYEKSLVFQDDDAANRILVTSTPLECKRIGEHILGFNQNKWDKVCEKIMIDACTAKFRQNPILMSY